MERAPSRLSLTPSYYSAARALPLEYTNGLRPLVTRSVRAILDAKATAGNCLAPFEEIFQAVHVLVSLQGEGRDVHRDVNTALESCVEIEFRKLMTMPLGDMRWLARLVQVWQWYESRLVRSLSSSCRHMRDGSSCCVFRVS